MQEDINVQKVIALFRKHGITEVDGKKPLDVLKERSVLTLTEGTEIGAKKLDNGSFAYVLHVVHSDVKLNAPKPKREPISVQKVLVLFKKIGIGPDIGDEKPLDFLKRNYMIELEDGSHIIAAPEAKGKYVYEHVDNNVMPSGEHTGDNHTRTFTSNAGSDIMLTLDHLYEKEGGVEADRHYSDEDEFDCDEVDDCDEDCDNCVAYKRWQRQNKTLKNVKLQPKVVFQFVQSKMTEMNQKDIRDRVAKLVVALKRTERLGQDGLYEALALKLSAIIKEYEAVALGCNVRVPASAVTFFINKVEDRAVRFKPFAEFPRVVPQENADIIQRVIDAEVFDSLHILYVDYVDEKFKTNKDRIREKDPIVFGRFDHQPEVLYFVTDWVDEHCDITLEQFITKVNADAPIFNIGPEETPENDEEFIKRILEDVEKKHLRLKKTNPRNYRRLMEQEEREARRRQRGKRRDADDDDDGDSFDD